MNTKMITCVFATLLFTSPFAEAQQPVKIAKVGWLGSRPALREDVAARGSEMIRRELRALGYVEGKNMTFEYRSAEGESTRLSALADELVRLKVDVLVMSTPLAAVAAKNATRTIPIVFLLAGDPVASGLVDRLPRPGGNITGFTTISTVLAGKQLELIKETVPKVSRVAVLWNPQSQASEQGWKESQLAAPELGLQLHSMDVSNANDLENVFKGAI